MRSYVRDRAFSESVYKELFSIYRLEPDDMEGWAVFPGFADVHVHLREPGFSYKETILTGCRAAACGGFTAVCTMPNLDPVPDTPMHLAPQLDAIKQGARISVLPFGAISIGQNGKEAADLEGLAPFVAGFSDDGRGVADRGLMREVMTRARQLAKPVVAHCEDLRYLPEDAKSEWSEVERDLTLADETGCALHICHVSSAVSLAMIQAAKQSGVNVTCETAPHYLLLDRTMRQDQGCWRMNPPLRGSEDREALVEGLLDGTIDMIATDHAPHSAEEKNGGFAGSLNGIVGLECAFPVLYTGLVETGILPLERLLYLMSESPKRRFGIAEQISDFTVFDLNETYRIDPQEFLSMGKSTPFAGRQVRGRCLLTVSGRRTVWEGAEMKKRRGVCGAAHTD